VDLRVLCREDRRGLAISGVGPSDSAKPSRETGNCHLVDSRARAVLDSCNTAIVGSNRKRKSGRNVTLTTQHVAPLPRNETENCHFPSFKLFIWNRTVSAATHNNFIVNGQIEG
jgi:hypothetical protein